MTTVDLNFLINVLGVCRLGSFVRDDLWFHCHLEIFLTWFEVLNLGSSFEKQDI